jgi:ABC-type transport system involved in multi-copper enzyme maturation permease subunit
MNTFKSYHYSRGKGFTEKFVGSFIFLLFIVLLFYLFFQLYKFLWFASPVFIIIAFILEPRVVFAYFKNIWVQITENLISGLVNALINVIGFPFVSIGLIFKAWVYKKFGKLSRQMNQDQFEEKFTPYEEMDFDGKAKNPNRQNAITDGRYDDLFE